MLGLSRTASADRIPVKMTPAIAKIIDDAKERVAKAKAVQLAKKEKANAARLAKLKKGKDDKTKRRQQGRRWQGQEAGHKAPTSPT